MGYFPHTLFSRNNGPHAEDRSHFSLSFHLFFLSAAGRPRFSGPAINAARDLQLVHDVVRLLQKERRQLEGKEGRDEGRRSLR